MNGTHEFVTTAVVVQRRENATELADDAEPRTRGDDADSHIGTDDSEPHTGFEAGFAFGGGER